MKALVWVMTAVVLLLWTAGAALLALLVHGLGAWLSGGAGIDWAAWVSSWSVPTWLLFGMDTSWLQSLQLLLVDMLDSLHGAAPELGGLSGWLLPLIAVFWAIGALLMLGLAWLIHRLVADSKPAPPPPPGAPSAGMTR